MTNKISHYTFYVGDNSRMVRKAVEDNPIYDFLPEHDFAPEIAILYGKQICIVNLPENAGKVLQNENNLDFIPRSLFSGKIDEFDKNDLVSKLKNNGLSVEVQGEMK